MNSLLMKISLALLCILLSGVGYTDPQTETTPRPISPEALWLSAEAALENSKSADDAYAAVYLLELGVAAIRQIESEYIDSDQYGMIIAGSPLPRQLGVALAKARDELAKWQKAKHEAIVALAEKTVSYVEDNISQLGGGVWPFISEGHQRLVADARLPSILPQSRKRILEYESWLRELVVDEVNAAESSRNWEHLIGFLDMSTALAGTERPWAEFNEVKAKQLRAEYEIKRQLTIENFKTENWREVEALAAEVLLLDKDDAEIEELQARAKFENLWLDAHAAFASKDFEAAWDKAWQAIRIRDERGGLGFSLGRLEEQERHLDAVVYDAALALLYRASQGNASGSLIEKAVDLVVIAFDRGVADRDMYTKYTRMIESSARITDYIGRYTRETRSTEIEEKYWSGRGLHAKEILGMSGIGDLVLSFQYLTSNTQTAFLKLDSKTGNVSPTVVNGRVVGATKDLSHILMVSGILGEKMSVLDTVNDRLARIEGRPSSISSWGTYGDDGIITLSTRGGNSRIQIFRVSHGKGRLAYKKSGRSDFCCAIAVSDDNKRLAIVRDNRSSIEIYEIAGGNRLDLTAPIISIPSHMYWQLSDFTDLKFSTEGTKLMIRGMVGRGAQRAERSTIVSLANGSVRPIYSSPGKAFETSDPALRRILRQSGQELTLISVSFTGEINLGQFTAVDEGVLVEDAAISPDGRTLAVMSADRAVRFYENRFPVLEAPKDDTAVNETLSVPETVSDAPGYPISEDPSAEDLGASAVGPRSSGSSTLPFSEADERVGKSDAGRQAMLPKGQETLMDAQGSAVATSMAALGDTKNRGQHAGSVHPDNPSTPGDSEPAVSVDRVARTEHVLPGGTAQVVGHAKNAKEIEDNVLTTVQERKEVQIRLSLLGFSPGYADGILGKRSRTAISGWQNSNGYFENGYLDGAQFRSLRAQSETSYQKYLTQRRSERSRVSPERTGRDSDDQCLRGRDGKIIEGQSFLCDAKGLKELFTR